MYVGLGFWVRVRAITLAWMTGDGEVLGASSSGSAAFRAKHLQRPGHLRPKILYLLI